MATGYKYRIGDRVRCFDHLRYVDDVRTPLSVTMRPAIVIGLGLHSDGRHLYEVRFSDRDSHAHFAGALELEVASGK